MNVPLRVRQPGPSLIRFCGSPNTDGSGGSMRVKALMYDVAPVHWLLKADSVLTSQPLIQTSTPVKPKNVELLHSLFLFDFLLNQKNPELLLAVLDRSTTD